MMDVRIWGMRGGTPVSGPETNRYGGNTACIEICAGKTLVILDGGSGLIPLGQSLMQRLEGKSLDARLFLSHLHWDHVMGIPYFLPVYRMPGKLTVYGVAGLEETLLSLFQGAEAGEYFPVPLGKPSSEVVFEELAVETRVEDAVISYYYLNHPGLTIGFRIDYEGKSIVYMSDNEPYRSSNRELARGDEDNSYLARIDREVIQFARDADLLIADAAYTDEEYEKVAGTGHSSVGDALKIGMSANAGKLVLFHHHPLRTDDQIDALVATCNQRVQQLGGMLQVISPKEGETIQI
jgi:phosphoribosyl 1,2-cyclic phosphodiesterase